MADDKKKNVIHLVGEIKDETPPAQAEEAPEIPFEKDGIYPTRGGWPALIIWIRPRDTMMWAIHAPGSNQESLPVIHNAVNGTAIPSFSIGAPPTLTGHPADILVTKIVKI